jgi:putative acetyltransferase
MAMNVMDRNTRGSYTIRRLASADELALVNIIETVRREYGVQRRIQSVIEPSDRELFATYQSARSNYFVAVHAEVVVGGAGIAPLAGAGEETCELQRMYLSLQHRGQGAGRLLLNQCLQQARMFGFRYCYAETISEMQEAIRFYEINGFRRLDAPLGRSGHQHNDCWLIRDLRLG